MGIRFQKLPPESLGFDSNEAPPDGIVWIVCRAEPWFCPERKREVVRIFLEGVGLSKTIAVRMCRDETYFIGPMPANVSLPRSPVEWIGCEYPLRRRETTPPPASSAEIGDLNQ